MNDFTLKYGCNPNQTPSKIYMSDGSDLPVTILNGKPGYINFLDALNSWQLVKELKAATNLPAAASFKHVSPAGAAVGIPLDDILKKVYNVENVELSSLATAYVRARGSDRMSSFGDWIALSDKCDVSTANIIKHEVSDGIIAPDYDEEALEILKSKRKGTFAIVKIDQSYVPAEVERKDVFGISFEQGRNNIEITRELLKDIVTENKNIPENAVIDLLIALITLKYTQSNSVCYAKNGQTIGVGAGQQSRIHCTRLAGDKADIWHLRSHPKVLALKFKETLPKAERDNAIDVYISKYNNDVIGKDVWHNFFEERPEELTEAEKNEFLSKINGVSLGSDAFFPFGDNIERAYRSGVNYIAEPGGSIRDDNVIKMCNKFNISMAFTKTRLFHH
ncbi:phosphoribosylaminoimidazolecarboxamide formyltransferase [Eubacteriales bacterium OttesenSCG-928-G02]|nr:phosphoribosylaminoimidazolecarboxamide formyltransferase [Eubacteriales bacterium OttesenSCG-928-G02]